MSRPAKGPRLYLVPARKDRRTGSVRAARWVIRDGAKMHPTGCGAGDVAEAHAAFAAWLKAAHLPARAERGAATIPVADVLSIYGTDVVAPHPDHARIARRLARLVEWWGDRTLADVTARTCRAYAASRPGMGGARRDLQDLSAAIGHHHLEGLHRESIKIWLPPKGSARERWLSRSEVAKLVWTCWRAREGGEREGDGRHTMRHLARFVLLAYATASRPGAVLTASWAAASGRSYLDLERGVFYRLKDGGRVTNKRQPPVPLPPKMLAHLRRWKRLADAEAVVAASEERAPRLGSFVVEYRGEPISRVKVGFASAVKLAGLGTGISPHTLRHSAVTHMLNEGVEPWQVAGYAGMSEAVMRGHYAHHHPDHMASAKAAMGGRGRQDLSRNGGR